MASVGPRKDKDGNLIGWQARVIRKGYPTQSKTFRTKADADRWARAIETEMDRGVWKDQTKAKSTTLVDLLGRYAREVTSIKKGKDTEMYRIEAMKRLPWACQAVTKITGKEIAAWRDQRLQAVSGSTVNREMNLLGHVFEVARKEWGISVDNPCRDVRRPKHNPARTRRISDVEIKWLLAAMDECRSPWLRSVFLLSLETGMRRGETLNLDWRYVYFDKQTAWLPDTKTDESRYVPLSSRAVEILQGLFKGTSRGPVFPVTANAVKLSWQRTVLRARRLYNQDCEALTVASDPELLMDLHFHDSRHEATSRAFEKGLNIMEVATVTGHKDLRSLKRYTQLHAEDVAKKLG
ncbi:site-specific integrase [Acidithiobacillus sp. MC6.1]|nr:site-specific integrase [Acidithiobacillus sp. MC6.1]